MTQAMNLANFSNYLDTSGQVAPTVLNAPVPVSKGGTGGTTSTGSGNLVLATSPTLITPILGTPASGVMTNVTGLPLTTGVTGTLPVANGGTGVTTSTGTGNNVLSTSPTITSPTITSPTITSPTINGTPVMGTSVLTSVAAVASTSGTSIDFTSIPSWVKRITINFQSVSTNGTNFVIVQLGTGSTTYTTSGYLGAVNSANSITNQTTGFGVIGQPTTANVLHGIATITNITGNNWIYAGTIYLSNTAGGGGGAGSVLLGATLTAVRITTIGGTDVFDSGTINILYE